MTASEISELLTPAVVVERDQLEANIREMQATCNRHGVALWPHIKTHKCVEVARLQLAAGAEGLTCAKLGEAEAMLASGVRRIFVAHSLVDLRQAPRLRRLREHLDELVLAVTSLGQGEALEKLLEAADIDASVLLAVDTGLGREGVRSRDDAIRLAERLCGSRHLRLIGLYTHEGHAYASPAADRPALVESVYRKLRDIADAIDPSLGLWPGCSVTAFEMAPRQGVRAIRPGAYVYRDLFQTDVTRTYARSTCALAVLATVVDRPEADLALIDAGSKVFSGDRTPDGIHARCFDGRDIAVTRLNEEHGYLRGKDVAGLRIGERLLFTPAHVCPVVNLTDTIAVFGAGTICAQWTVEARGKTN